MPTGNPRITLDVITRGILLSPAEGGVVTAIRGCFYPSKGAAEERPRGYLHLPASALGRTLQRPPRSDHWHLLMGLHQKCSRSGYARRIRVRTIGPVFTNYHPAESPDIAYFPAEFHADPPIDFTLPEEFSDIVTTNPLASHRWFVAADWLRDNNAPRNAEALDAVGRLVHALLSQNHQES